MELTIPAADVGNLLFWCGTIGAALLTFAIAEPIKIALVWIMQKIFKFNYTVTTLPRFWKLVSPLPAALVINWVIMLFEGDVQWNQMPLRIIVSSALSVYAYNMFKPKLEELRQLGKLPS